MSGIGVLALQGAFAEHGAMLDRLGAEWFEIRQPRDLDRGLDGLILPGGESTVMGRLLRDLELYKPLSARIDAGMPVLGTCAGLILLAGQVEGGTPCFAAMNCTAKRNAYGRQLGSFAVSAPMAGVGTIPMTFIRAPYLAQVGPEVEVLATVEDRIVAARQGPLLVTAFHPELTECTKVHELFLDMVGTSACKSKEEAKSACC